MSHFEIVPAGLKVKVATKNQTTLQGFLTYRAQAKSFEIFKEGMGLSQPKAYLYQRIVLASLKNLSKATPS